jgi:hypothetical protein
MQRGTGNKIRTKFRKKDGAPFAGAAISYGMLGGGGGGMGMMMNKKFHAKAHEKMGMGKGEKKEDTEVDQIAQQEKEASKPGKAPVNKKDE